MTVSDVVLSLNGHDAGKPFVVLSIQDGYAFLANGKTRRVDKPKQKKLKHCRYLAPSPEAIAEKIRRGTEVTNHELRKALAEVMAGVTKNEEVR